MINQELLSYIKKRLEKGSSLEEIKETLIGAGWKETMIDEAFSFLENTQVPQALPETFIPSPEQPIVKDKKRLPWKKILIAIIAVGGIAFGAYSYYSSRPLMIIDKALEKLPEIKSFQTNSQLKVQIDSQTIKKIKEENNLAALDSEYSFQLKTGVNFNNFQLDSEISSDKGLAAELKITNNVLYGKLNQAELDLAPYFKPQDIEEAQTIYETLKNILIDKWIKLSDIDSSQFVPSQTAVQEICQNIIANQSKIFKKITKTNDNGYKIEIDKNALPEELINQELKEIVTIDNLEVWIEKKTGLIKKFKISLSIKLSEASEAEIIQYEVNFSNFNQPLIVQPPEKFSLPEEIIKEYEASILQNPLYPIALKDKEIISKMELLKESALTFKEEKGTYVNFEKSNAFLAPWRIINKQGGAPLIMYYSQDAFCIQKELLSSKHYCVDSTGYSGNEAYCDKTSCDCKK